MNMPNDLDKCRAKRREARLAVLKMILEAGPDGVRLVGGNEIGFGLDLLEEGFVSCDPTVDCWTIRSPEAARSALKAPPGVKVTPFIANVF
jgi:hypothetical protein